MTPMEDRVRQLEISLARQEVVVDNLTQVVQANTTAITELTSVLNKAKGAGWIMAGSYTLFGGLIAGLVGYFKG